MKFLERHQGWIQWGSAMAVVCALRLADARFVTKTDYAEDRKATEKSLVDMSTAIALLQQNGKNLEDHEQRLRFLEHSHTKANSSYELHDIPATGIFTAPDVFTSRERADSH
jgi:hypothetical protein